MPIHKPGLKHPTESTSICEKTAQLHCLQLGLAPAATCSLDQLEVNPPSPLFSRSFWLQKLSKSKLNASQHKNFESKKQKQKAQLFATKSKQIN